MVANPLMERDPLAQIRSQTAAVIPAYQDEKHIGDIVRRTRERLGHVLVIDDGSNDQTAQRAREAGSEVIVHTQNRGKGEAIKTGLGHWLAAASPSSGGLDREVRWVSLLDSDGQHLPEEIERFPHGRSTTDPRAPRRGRPFRLRNRGAHHHQPQRLPDRISSNHHCLH